MKLTENQKKVVQVCPSCSVYFICDGCEKCDAGLECDCECFDCRDEHADNIICGDIHYIKPEDCKPKKTFIFR